MDLRQLHYFTVIVESGSMAKASRRLYIAQPSLSQQVAKLEEEVGKQLLSRSSKGVTPTENGLALYHQARFILRQVDQALTIARRDSAEVHGMTSIGLPATTVMAMGLPLLRRLRERYPNILLNVVEGMSGHLAKMLRAGELDMAILFTPDAAPDLVATPLLEEELFVLLPKASPLVEQGRTSLTLTETAQLPLILPTGTHGLRRRISAEFERRNLLAKVVVEIDSLSLLMRCVYEGMGATIKPFAALNHEVDSANQWRALSISDTRISRRNYLYTAPVAMLSPAASLVATEIQNMARSLASSGDWPAVRLLD
ncbi:MAG: LysR substrate-binding domain-containing protein [Burkholderiaceae bacterium]